MQQQKRKKTKQCIIAGFLILLMIYMFPIYHIPSVLFQPSYYSADEIARLAYRGGLRSHMEEIGHRLDVLRSVYPDERPNTRTEMLEQIERIQELCMDCLRLAAFVESGGSA